MSDTSITTPTVPFVSSNASPAQDLLARFREANQQAQHDTADLRFVERLGHRTLLSSAEFAGAQYSLDWLVTNVLVKGQPAVFGGPKKTLKTNLLIDLAITLGAPPRPQPAKFLGRFQVPRPVHVGLFSGESGQHTIQETARRICRAYSVSLRECSVFWGFNLPRLRDAHDLLVLSTLIERHALEVVILDPLYLSLVGGPTMIEAANLYSVGPALADVARVCLEAGATPVLAHHARKNRAQDERWQPLDLEDLAYAGVSEFGRQWVLLSRRAAFVPGSGKHELLDATGGQRRAVGPVRRGRGRGATEQPVWRSHLERQRHHPRPGPGKEK